MEATAWQDERAAGRVSKTEQRETGSKRKRKKGGEGNKSRMSRPGGCCLIPVETASANHGVRPERESGNTAPKKESPSRARNFAVRLPRRRVYRDSATFSIRCTQRSPTWRVNKEI